MNDSFSGSNIRRDTDAFLKIMAGGELTENIDSISDEDIQAEGEEFLRIVAKANGKRHGVAGGQFGEHVGFQPDANARSQTEAETSWVMGDFKEVLRDARKYLSHAADVAHQEGASELRLILDSMKNMLNEIEAGRDPHQALNDIAVSVKILKKSGHIK